MTRTPKSVIIKTRKEEREERKMKKVIVVVFDRKTFKTLTNEECEAIIKAEKMDNIEVTERFKKIFRVSDKGDFKFID